MNWDKVRGEAQEARAVAQLAAQDIPPYPLFIVLEEPGQRRDAPVQRHGQLYCPMSGHLLKVRHGQHGPFLGCLAYSTTADTNCRYTHAVIE